MGTGPLLLPNVALAVMVIGCCPFFVQGPTGGSIFGTVTDTSGGFVSGVSVTCAIPAQMGTQVAISNDRGQYRFPLLNPGIYTLSYDRSGFATLVREGIVVNVGFSAEVNVELAVATIEQTVVVRGDTPLIDTQSTTVQSTFPARC